MVIILSVVFVLLGLVCLFLYKRIKHNNRCYCLVNFTIEQIRKLESITREESVAIMNCAIAVYNESIKFPSKKMGYFPLVHEIKNDSKK